MQKAIFIGIDGVQLERLLLLGLQGEAEALLGMNIVESYTGGEIGTATQQATSSGPGWSTLLSGVWVDQHGISSNSNLPITSEVDSIFEYVDEAIVDANIASVVHWSPINTGHFALETGGLSEPSIVDTVDSGKPDSEVANTVVGLIENEAPDFTFVHLDEVDGAGHASGWGEAYNEAIIAASQQVGQILAAVAQRELDNPDEDWLVVVSTDHGRDALSGNSHGGQSDSERRTFIASNKPLGDFDDPVPATSVVPTILDHLGIPFELSADGLESGSLLEGAADPIPPKILTLLGPVDDAARVPLDSDLSLRFSEDIQAGTGSILVKLLSDDSVAATIDVTSDSVTIVGDKVTIDLPADLAAETAYYVEIEAGAFTDGSNAFEGISDKTAWNFETLSDLLPPEIVSLDPADDLDEVPVESDLTIQFDEAVVAGSGSILILRASDDSLVETIDVTSGQVVIDGASVTIDPSADLEPGVEYYVQIEPGAIRDTASRTTLFAEDFEDLALEPFVNEAGGDGTDFTATPPAGWVHDNPTPAGGPAEFFGWTFLDKGAWITAAEGQRRDEFTKGLGTVLVADPDEYDDGATDIDPDLFNAFMSTPEIDLTNVEAGTATLTFDSSWLPEDSQKANLTVSFDGGDPIELLRFTSDPTDPNYRGNDATNESITLALDNPEGASSAVITFGMIDSGNDWWWAIDNVVVQGADSSGAASGNAFAGISDKVTWSFTTQPAEETGDTTAPMLIATTPQDDASGVPGAIDLVAQFDEAIQKGTGSIVIRDAADDSLVETIDVASDQVTVDGDSLTIDPLADLAEGGSYYVQIDAGAITDTANVPVKSILFQEDFESLATELGPLVSPTESGGDGSDFTATLPDGWTQENGTPTGGPVEFFGWTFFDADAWTATAEDQGRGLFTKADGVVMVADADEYDDGDTDIDPDQFQAAIRTSDIDLTGVTAGSASLTFDSSWIPENLQKARVLVSYDGAEATEVLRFTSDPTDPDYKASATNETITLDLDNPEGAANAKITFELFDAGNNWWWAIDNILVEGATGAVTTANAYEGIDDATSWNFSTQEMVDPGNGGGEGAIVGDADDNVLRGTSGDDIMSGGAGDDELSGGIGNDQMSGDEGDDAINGGIGDDEVEGGEGDDVLSGGIGDDEVGGGAGDDVIKGGIGDDLIAGGEGDDVLSGGIGNDEIDGGDGDDVLKGGIGDDLLSGGQGDDDLYGGIGDDLIVGGAGDDRLSGGLGLDQFVFAQGSGQDVVTDFNAGSDQIRLEGYAFADFDAVLAAAAETDDGVVLTLDGMAGDQITLLGVDLSQLHDGNVWLA